MILTTPARIFPLTPPAATKWPRWTSSIYPYRKGRLPFVSPLTSPCGSRKPRRPASVAGIAKGKYEAKGGTAGDIIITVWDSLENKTEYKALTGITLDGNTPGLSNLFPTADTAPKDADNEDAPTIGPVTKNPAFQINEELDSLSVRYHEAGGGTAIVQAYGPGNARLETVGSLVSWPVNDTTFIDRQRYDLEILAIDLAGNASVTEGGTLTFKDVFTNPDADMFKIVPDAAQKEKVVSGVDYSIAVSVLDTTLTRMEKEQDSAAGDVRAVTYHTPSAMAAIVSGDQAEALEGASFSGTGVAAAPAFTLPAELSALGMVAKAAIMDEDGWHAGQPHRQVQVLQAADGSGTVIRGGRRLSTRPPAPTRCVSAGRLPSRSTSRSRSSRSSGLRRSRVKFQPTTWPAPLRSL